MENEPGAASPQAASLPSTPVSHAAAPVQLARHRAAFVLPSLWVVVRRSLEKPHLWIAMTAVVWSVVWVYASDVPYLLWRIVSGASG